ncbi:MAG: DUF3857 domain-containing protein [Bacteroidota bacterium]
MKKIISLTALVFLIQLALHAETGKYAVSKIDTVLLKRANAVVRLEEVRFEIVSTKETIETNHYAITVLNEKGDKWADFGEFYDKHREINSIDGTLYDAWGKELKSMRKKDAEDLSATSDGTLISDNRYKHHNFYYKVYPYTVEYTVEIKNKSTLFFPSWYPQSSELLSVENSSFNVVAPTDYRVRYKMFNYNGEPIATQEKNKKVLTWTAKNLKSLVREPYAPTWRELTIGVILGPSQFQMDDYVGNMVSWQDFGKFVYSLKQGKDILTEPVKKEVHRITDGLSDKKEKIALLYQYMQKNTRYISIQLGIGGWQPFDAKDVATKGYGDCKALSNYMYSLLKEAGINSYYTLVKAGRNERSITEDFPSQQFNHVILSVPLQTDTMWLECTDQTLPAGYMSGFTCNRKALLIDENGGKLINTPVYNIADNIELKNIKATLEDDGTLLIRSSSKYSGLQQDNIHEMIHALSKDKVKEYLETKFDFATYDINEFEYQSQKSSMPAINEMLDITVSNYATITGKRLFIVPNVMSRSNAKIVADSTRKYDFDFDVSYRKTDTVEIEIPNGFTSEAMPPPVTITSKFGIYRSNVKLVENKLFYFRNIEFTGGHFPATAYPEFVKFYDAIFKADRNKVVLVKNS